MSDNILNNFLNNLGLELRNIDENNKENYMLYKCNNFLKEQNNNLNIENILTNIKAKNNIDIIEKIIYNEDKKDICLITQYFKSLNKQRLEENNVSLINNIQNEEIDKIILLNEEEYNLDEIYNSVDININEKNKKKVEQIVIGNRLRYYDVFEYVNKNINNMIIILCNLDIFFTEEIKSIKTMKLDNIFFSLSRYDLKNKYNFIGKNKIEKFIHEGPLGEPCIDSADSWIFDNNVRNNEKTKIMLGACGCDTAINYIMNKDLEYNVINCVNSIKSIHYHLMTQEQRNDFNKNSIRTYGDKIYNINNDFKPYEMNHLYLNPKRLILCNKIQSFCTISTKKNYYNLKLLLKSIELYHSDIHILIYCDKYVNDKIEECNYDLKILKKIKSEENNDINTNDIDKINIIDYAMELYTNTLFIDCNTVIIDYIDLLIDKNIDIGLINNDILKENINLMYINNKNITEYWRKIILENKLLNNQQYIKYFKELFNVYEFDINQNYEWYNLFESENPEKTFKLFSIDFNNIFYNYKKLKCINSDFFNKCNNQIIQFNNLILEKLKKINHKIYKYIIEDNTNINNDNIINNDLNKNNNNVKILSLGSSFDGANILKYLDYQKENNFFDFLWNELDGLNLVSEIINNDFKYLDNIENYIYQKNEIIAWEGSIINNKIINKYYPNLLFFHMKEKINITHIDSIKRKIIRTQEILNSKKHKYFIYYRHQEYCNDLDILINESNNFSNIYKEKYNSNFTLLSCIMINSNMKQNEKDILLNKLNKNNTNNIKYSYLYKTDDYNIKKTNISRKSWINMLEKNIKNKYIIEDNTNIKPTIIIPNQIINDVSNYNNHSTIELIYLWEKLNLCFIKKENTNYIWYNKIGDTLIYDKENIDLEYDLNIKYKKILFINQKNLKYSKNSIFITKYPKIIEEKRYNLLQYKDRFINSIFIDKIQNDKKNLYIKYEKYIDMFILNDNNNFIYSYDEYLYLIKHSKFGLCINNFDSKYNRILELMSLGTVPIIENNVFIDFNNKLEENIHYLRINNINEINNIIETYTEDKWSFISNNCIKWYNQNCNIKNLFDISFKIANNKEKIILKKEKTTFYNNIFDPNNLILNN